MKQRFSQILVFAVLFVLLSACVEKAKPSVYQYINLYTDYPDYVNQSFFREFGRKNKIQVILHHKSSDKIIKQLLEKKYESGIDLVLLSNPLDLLELNKKACLYLPKGESDYYQALLNDPYVFLFPNDTIPLFTSYGQLFRNDRININHDSIANQKEWGNLIGGLVKKYPKNKQADIYQKILRCDTLKGKDVKYMKIAPYSTVIDKKQITFPDQYYKGSIGKISGIAVVRNGKHMSNAILLYEYCKNEWWRKKLAGKMKLFPVLPEESAKKEEIILFHEILKN